MMEKQIEMGKKEEEGEIVRERREREKRRNERIEIVRDSHMHAYTYMREFERRRKKISGELIRWFIYRLRKTCHLLLLLMLVCVVVVLIIHSRLQPQRVSKQQQMAISINIYQ